ncbi:MAG: paraquat-inducible protein A [Parahaliea sp.]
MTLSRNILALVLMLVSIALLYPGVTQPVLTLSGSIEKTEVVNLGVNLMAVDEQGRQTLAMFTRFLGLDRVEGRIVIYESTRSIWATVDELARTGNLAVALLIVLFSLVIPVFKLLLQAGALLPAAGELRRPLLVLNAALSKWSMTDVFVMALLVAYMAGTASGQMGDSLLMEARLESGFWYFLAYCLFSIGASALVRREFDRV